MRVGLAAISLALMGLASVQAEDTRAGAFVERDDLIVITGAELPQLRGAPISQLRAFAQRGARLEAIAFQVDERTPELDYCWTRGRSPVKDVDSGRLDDDDELVFLARDAGTRASREESPGAGTTGRVEVSLSDGAQDASVYVYAFGEDAPPRATARHVGVLEDRSGGLRFRGRTFDVAVTGSLGTTGVPRNIRVARADGTPGPVIVRNAARTHLQASHSFVRIERDEPAMRTSMGSSFLDGPVRVVVPVALEAYLVWGNWITARRSYVSIHGRTWELRASVAMPVSLDEDGPSTAALGVELTPPVAEWTLRNEHNKEPVLLANATALDRRFSNWCVLSGPHGAVVTRLVLDPRLASPRSTLHLDLPQGFVGFSVDLTGLRKADEAQAYDVHYLVRFLPGYRRGDEQALLREYERPLRVAVR
jgi:hypothetical protein